MILVGGAALWYVQFRPGFPDFSQAQTVTAQSDEVVSEVRSEVTRIDQQVADQIRRVAEEGIQLPDWSQVPEVASTFQSASQATLSATVSTTPEELWQTLRDQGAQAVLGTVAQNAEVSVNNLSTDIMNEARYQYCVGVVQEYERQRAQ